MTKRTGNENGNGKEIKELITKAALLNEEVKAGKKTLDGLKEELTDWYVETGHVHGAKHEGNEGTSVTVAETDVFEAISVQAVHNLLDTRGLSDKFLACLNVNMTQLRKILGAEDIKMLQGESIGVKYSLRLAVKK